MKNILRTIFIFVVGALILVSCEKKESNWDAMTKDWDPNQATYYLQLLGNKPSYATDVAVDGSLIEIQAEIGVVLLGNPLSDARSVTIKIDPTSTLTPDMYTIDGGLTLTIQPGEISATTTITSIAENMPVETPLVLKLSISDDANAHTTSSTATYTFSRANFCPWSVDDMVGTYTGTDYSDYENQTMTGAKFEIFKVDDTHIAISGLAQSLIVGFWGETVTAGDRVVFEYVANGRLILENQYLCQSDNIWDYYIGPRAEITWDGCAQSFDIPWGWHWNSGYEDSYMCWSKFTKD